MQFGEHFHHFFGDFHRVGTALLLDYNHGALLTVVVGDLSAFFKRVIDTRHVAQEDVAALVCTYYHRSHLVGGCVFTLHAERVSVGADVERAARNIAVFSGDCSGDAFDGEVISLKAFRVNIDVDFALWSA